MTYRGVYRDGIVILEGEVNLRNGAPVEVNPASNRKPRKSPRTRAKPASNTRIRQKRKSTSALPGFGMWKDRWPKSVSTAELSLQLREKASRRTR